MTYMGMFHSDESLRDYEDQFFNDYDLFEEEDDREEEYDDYEPSDNSGCYECGGRGYVVRCIDDLCYGQDECIHGDPPKPCRVCNKDGNREDALW